MYGNLEGRIIHVKGRRFLWSLSTLYEFIGKRLVPRMLLTKDRYWLDDNNDGHVGQSEIHKIAVGKMKYWGNPMDSRLNIYFLEKGITWAAQGGKKTHVPYEISCWEFKGFNSKGGLQYNEPQSKKSILRDPDGGAVADWYVDDKENVFVLISGGSLKRGEKEQGSGHRLVRFAADGRKLWEYQNVHCAFAWTSDSYSPGRLVGAMGVGGVTDNVVEVTGYYGQYFLLDRETGLFIDVLGEDQRSPYTMGMHMVLTGTFNGSIYKNASDGKTYLIGGDADDRLWELSGVKKLDTSEGNIDLTPEQVAMAKRNATLKSGSQQTEIVRKSVRIKRVNGIAPGKLPTEAQWQTIPPLEICKSKARSANAKLAYDNQNLYVFYKVTGSKLKNLATDYHYLFKTGAAVEIQLGNDLKPRQSKGQNIQTMSVGDLLLLMTRNPQGKFNAAAIYYKLNHADAAREFTFKSPVWQQKVDAVESIDKLPVSYSETAMGYQLIVAISWKTLHLKPVKGMRLTGDVGVIFSNKGGTKNAIRFLWSDKSPEVSINNDIPSEMRIHPNQWGTFILE